MMKLFRYLMPVLLVGFAAGCETLKETYEEWSGDGPLHYLTRVYELEATVKWKAVDLKWETLHDPGRTNIRIEWFDGTRDDVGYVDVSKDALGHTLTNLFGQDYSFTVSAVELDADGEVVRKSKSQSVFARPVNERSEQVTYFPSMVLKTIKLSGNRLYLSFDKWADGLEKMVVEYTDRSGAVQKPEFTEQADKMFNYSYVYYPDGYTFTILENVDYTKDVIVRRSGVISLNDDDAEADEEEDMIRIDFPEIKLDLDQVNMNPDFAATVRYQYPAIQEFTYELLAGIEELHFNYTVTSFEDLLYFSDLKRLVLGGERYWAQSATAYPWSSAAAVIAGSSITVPSPWTQGATVDVNVGQWRSTVVLGNSYGIDGMLKGKISVMHYGYHYFSYNSQPGWFTHTNDNPAFPADLEYWDGTGWGVTATPVGMVQMENLLDNNQATIWKSRNDPNISRTNALVFDMGEEKHVRGFVLVQPQTHTSQSAPIYSLPLLPNAAVVNIEVGSTPNGPWTNATPSIDIRVGPTDGERTVVYIDPQDHTATLATRFVRLTITDVEHKDAGGKTIYGVALSDFNVIKPL